MSFYADSKYPVREDVAELHAEQFNRLGAPGTWGTAAQRIAIVNEARKAGYEAGVVEKPDNAGAEPDVPLPEVVKRVVHRMALAPKDMNQNFYNDAISDGLADVEYVEILGLLARFTCFDVFARGIGVPLRPMPEPQSGEPSQERPAEAVQEKAWVPTIPAGPDGGEFGLALFGPWQPYIMRGISLVPDEYRQHHALEEVQYMPSKNFMEFDYQHHEGLSRPQAEIVASRVSVLNECFY